MRDLRRNITVYNFNDPVFPVDFNEILFAMSIYYETSQWKKTDDAEMTVAQGMAQIFCTNFLEKYGKGFTRPKLQIDIVDSNDSIDV